MKMWNSKYRVLQNPSIYVKNRNDSKTESSSKQIMNSNYEEVIKYFTDKTKVIKTCLSLREIDDFVLKDLEGLVDELDQEFRNIRLQLAILKQSLQLGEVNRLFDLLLDIIYYYSEKFVITLIQLVVHCVCELS